MRLSDTPRILVLNKWDLIASSPHTGGPDSVAHELLPQDEIAVLTSAIEGWGIEDLREEIDSQLNLQRVAAGTTSVAG